MMARRARVFGHRVEFGRDFTGIICASRDLDTPLPAADPVMARHVQQYLEPLLARVDATVCDKIRQLVYELLPSGRCSSGWHRALACTHGLCIGISPVMARPSRRSWTPREPIWHSAMLKITGDLYPTWRTYWDSPDRAHFRDGFGRGSAAAPHPGALPVTARTASK